MGDFGGLAEWVDYKGVMGGKIVWVVKKKKPLFTKGLIIYISTIAI